jgi:hypothetical protein
LYTLVAVAVTVAVARHSPGLRDLYKPLVWLAILMIAALRSPFLPQAYAVLPALWLVTLLSATHVARWATLGTMLILWAMLGLYWPMDWPMDPRLLALLTTVPQGVFIALAVLTCKSVLDASPRRRSLLHAAA